LKVRVLGCGTSSGVPRIGNEWGACDPHEPRNRRLRVSIIVEFAGARILVDTGPDLREQLLAAQIDEVDAIIWTHDHADHCHGIDDVRQLFHKRGGPVPGYARPATLAALYAKFGYTFEGNQGYPPTVTAASLPDRLPLGGGEIHVVDQPHGSITSAGLVFEEHGKRFVYATDFNVMTDDMKAAYRGADLWIVDTLRRAPHPTHPHLDQALGWIDELKPAAALLTHMDHSMDYRQLCATLPPHVRPAHDGQEIAL
jgi:phosphoribosyl 1,2-cyclic phosphate phosphodiesterase